MEGSETYNHSKVLRPRRDTFKQCLNKMHGLENTHMPVFLKFLDNTRSQRPPLLHANGPRTRKEESCPPPPPKGEGGA